MTTVSKTANRLRPMDVFTPSEWAAVSAREDWRGPALVAHAWGVIAAAFALVALWPHPLTWLVAVMLVGARQLGLAILMHEAAHGALHRNRRINDGLGHWLCAAPVGAALTSYRSYHLAHHKYVQEDGDPDRVLVARFPVSFQSLRRKFIRDLTGQTFVRQRLAGVAALRAASPGAAAQADVLAGGNALRDHLIVNAALWAVLALAGVWWIYPAVWLVALATWFPFVTRIRNIAEHACLPYSDDPLAHARSVRASWWERLFIAPYWVHHHAEHHAFMHVPCYRLADVRRALAAKGLAGRMVEAASYRAVLHTAASARPEPTAT